MKDGPLYVRGGQTNTDEVVLRAGETVSFDTYFNALSCSSFACFTSVKTLVCRVRASGKTRCAVWHTDGSETRLLAEGTEKISCVLPEKGRVHLTVRAEGTGAVVRGAQWESEEDGKDVRLAVVICSYRREEYVKNTVAALTEHVRRTGGTYRVFVVDNGKTLRPEDVEGAELLVRKNLGGSGGFSAGMAEARKTGGFTHVVLLDDDVKFHAQIVDRIADFFSLTDRENVAVCGAMLRMDEENVLYELGGVWDGVRIRGVYQNMDVSVPENITFDTAKTDYGAWWCCAFPMENVEKNGLSMPFFIKTDDVEFGVRNGFKWAFLNGVAVWHEPFGKKYAPYLEYYVKRNELVTNCLTRDRSGGVMFGKLIRNIGGLAVRRRAAGIPYVFLAYRDFLTGTAFFGKTDGEAYNEELRSGRAIKKRSAFIVLLGAPFRVLSTGVRMLFSYGKARRDYIQNGRSLASLEAWEERW